MTQHTPPHRPARLTVRGRGTSENPAGRFEKQSNEADADFLDTQDEAEKIGGVQIKVATFCDTTKSIISTNDSPDVGMDTTVNSYRGCEHGCIYCFARPYHEYLGLSAGLDFETKIYVKHDGPRLLAEKLASKNWQPRIVTMSGVTDCYQPIEKKFELTRKCLHVLNDFRNPVAIITKNALVTRDIDIFTEMAAWNGAAIHMSVTSLDPHTARTMEPRASQPHQRLRAIEALAKAGVPVSVIIGPVVPGLTDHEIPAILEAAANAGARGAHYTLLRLPYGVKDLFQHWLVDHYPDRAARVISHVRDTREGKLNSSEFGERMRGTGRYAEQISAMFNLYKKKYGLERKYHSLSTEHFRRNARSPQPDLFDL